MEMGDQGENDFECFTEEYWVSVELAAQALGTTVEEVYGLIRQGPIRAKNIEGWLMVDKSSLASSSEGTYTPPDELAEFSLQLPRTGRTLH